MKNSIEFHIGDFKIEKNLNFCYSSKYLSKHFHLIFKNNEN